MFSLNPLEIYNFIFAAPLALGLILSLLQIFGGDADADADVDFDTDLDLDMDVDGDLNLDFDLDADTDVDADTDHNSSTISLLGLLGLRDVPLFLGLSVLLLLFGLSGYLLNSIFLSGTEVSSFVLSHFLMALAVSFVGTPAVTRLVAKVLPKGFTTMTNKSLLGKVGSVSTLLEPEGKGNVNVEIGGLTETVRVRLHDSEQSMRRGERVLIVHFDPDEDRFLCVPYTDDSKHLLR